MKINKKKLIILIGVLIFSISLIYGANYLKSSLTDTSNKKITTEVKEDKESKIENEDNKTKDNIDDVEKKEDATDDKNKTNNNEDNTLENNNTTNSMVENSSGNVENDQSTTITNSSSNTETKNEETNVSSSEHNIVQAEEKKKPSISMQIIDEATNSFSAKNYTIEFTKGESLNDIMKRFLPQYATDYKIIEGYLSKLFGLKERDKGVNSGWVFYVNGVKSPVGMKDTYLNDGDNVTWKYVKDGVNN